MAPPPTLTRFFLLPLFLLLCRRAQSSTFTFVNKCDNTVWPGILSNAGSASLETTGFELPAGTTRAFQAPTGWSGRFWARTGCSLDSSSRFTCSTGDCGSGQVECNGAGAAPPATLAEFTLAGGGGMDFYDVSLVDGYNLPMVVEVTGTTPGGATSNGCMSTGCAADLNRACPAELRVGAGEACRSACEAFGKPEYCCNGEFGNPNTCKPSVYSEMFKTACPRSYSYAYDDATSTFTCVGGDYAVTFCPASVPSSSLKSSEDPTPPMTITTASAATATVTENDAWLASLATGDANTLRRTKLYQLLQALFISASTCILLRHVYS